jgi:hypothetical protein
MAVLPPRARTWGRIGRTAANADWLTVVQLPACAPDLNPTEGIWSLAKRGIGNLAAADLDQITEAVKRRLKKIQYRPHLVDGCIAASGLALGSRATRSPRGRRRRFRPGLHEKHRQDGRPSAEAPRRTRPPAVTVLGA